MKAISAAKDFDQIEMSIDRAIDRSKMLPDRVFRSTLKYFLFITFDELYMTLFFNHVKRYLDKVGERAFWLVTIDPDPRSYFFHHFGFYGAFEFLSSDNEDDYVSALNDYPKDNHADSLMSNSNSLVAVSSSGEWAIFSSRDDDIAICGFSDRAQMEIFRSVYGSDLLNDVNAAAEYAYATSGDAQRIERFHKNYSSDWALPTTPSTT